MKPDEKLASARVKEVGYQGLSSINGIIQENIVRDLVFPYNIRTYKQMGFDSSVASAINTIMDFIENIEWFVDEDVEGLDPNYPRGFIQECMNDLNDQGWKDVVREALTIIPYGFCVQEKVWKRRNNIGKYKSKYDDGLIGWAKLPIRSQDTIRKWLWSVDGRELLGVQQDINLVKGYEYRYGSLTDKTVNIPRSKFLLHRYRPHKDNPEGYSPLNSAYISWKYKTAIEEYEAIGVSRDMSGWLVLGLPPEYLADDAPEDKKEIRRQFENILRNYQANQSAGMLFPRYIDPESKQDLFSIKLQGVEGSGKQFDTDKIINRYEKKILMTFLADVLGLGHDQVGSYALSSDKTHLLSVKINTFLNYILKVFNEDLIPHTFRMNGWSDKVTPKIKHTDIEKMSLDEVGKFLQRVISVGGMEKDKSLSNFARSLLPLEKEGKGEPMDESLVGDGGRSRAGESQGSSGTGVTKQTNSETNSENSAFVDVDTPIGNVQMMKEDYEELTETKDGT